MQINLMRHAGVFLTVTFAVVAASALLKVVSGHALPPGLAVIIPAMAAAQAEGRAWGQAQGRLPEGGPAWIAALVMTGVAVLFTLLLLLIQLAVPGVIGAVTQMPANALLALYAVLLVAVFVTSRLFLTLGAQTALKRRNRDGA